MRRHDDIDELRAELRRLWSRAEHGAGGDWEAPMSPTEQTVLIATNGTSCKTIATFTRSAAAELAALSHNAVPLLFREIDAQPAPAHRPPVPAVGA